MMTEVAAAFYYTTQQECMQSPLESFAKADKPKKTRANKKSQAVQEAAKAAVELQAEEQNKCGRAAKRVRCRERRKLFKTLAREQKAFEEDAHASQDDSGSTCSTAASSQDVQALEFQVRLEAAAADIKLVIKNTSYDVEEAVESDEDEIVLPPALFKTTSEIDDWRRQYRKFRLGYFRRAKGEVAAHNIPSATRQHWADMA